jgi:hypothetical protein
MKSGSILPPIIVENELSSCVEITNDIDLSKPARKSKKREIKCNQKLKELKESKKKSKQSTLDVFVACTLKENKDSKANKAETEANIVHKSLNMYESSIGLTKIENRKEKTRTQMLNAMLSFITRNGNWKELGNENSLNDSPKQIHPQTSQTVQKRSKNPASEKSENPEKSTKFG